MPPYRRSRLAGACVVITSLFYIYWLLRPASDEQIRLYRPPDGDDVLNSTLGFAQIFVINLPSRPDRRAAMSRAAAASNLSVTWRAGLAGAQVADHLPGLRSPGARGSWRAHMDAVAAVAAQGATAASGGTLIMEDDVDWDVRLRGQLADFAGASRAWLQRQQQHQRTASSAPAPALERYHHHTNDDDDDDEGEHSIYGAGWDVLWLGHCGTDLPRDKKKEEEVVVALPDDATVPAPRHLRPHPFALRDEPWGEGAAPPPHTHTHTHTHTRLVLAARGTACSLAYAVSGRGARRIAAAFAFADNHHHHNKGGAKEEEEEEEEKRYYQWDLMLRDWCQGTGTEEEEEEAAPVCITVQPPLVSHYYAGGGGSGGGSDIRGQGGGYARGAAGSAYVRLSVRRNLERLEAAAGGWVPERELVDQWPDEGGETPW
ncbi:glycosyltransferase family 25 protein [Biscogniauxia mediterranea]|nr:glycosyltransferase family 25 protein [Biscogniauxia mediterranea]